LRLGDTVVVIVEFAGDGGEEIARPGLDTKPITPFSMNAPLPVPRV
jgi:hypothetical protein